MRYIENLKKKEGNVTNLKVGDTFECKYGTRRLIEIRTKGTVKYAVLDESEYIVYNVQDSIVEVLSDYED